MFWLHTKECTQIEKKLLEVTHIHQRINQHQQIVQKKCNTKKLETNLTNCSNKPCILPQALCTQEQNNFQKTPILHIEQITLGKKF